VVGTGFISLAGNVPSGVPVVIWSITPSQRVGPLSVATAAGRRALGRQQQHHHASRLYDG
jgi:hypothetical protein